MRQIIRWLMIALSGLALAGCKESSAKHKLLLETQWHKKINAFIVGDKAEFESILNASTKAQPEKVNGTFGVVNGLAKLLKFTENDVHIENVEFSPEFTLAKVKTAYI